MKLKNDNIHLKQQVANIEDQSDTLHNQIKKKDELLNNMKGCKSREVDLAKQVQVLKEVNEAQLSDGKKQSKKLEHLQEQESYLRNLAEERQNTIDELNVFGLRTDDYDNEAALDRKFEKLSTIIIDRVSKIVDDKLNTIDNKIQNLVNIPDNITYAEKVEKSVISDKNQRSTTVSSFNNAGNDFLAIMKDAKNEELVQEQERKGRSRNLIIHGVPEMKQENDSVKTKSHDEEFVTLFLTKIDIAMKPTAIHRIGKSSNKDRPIKMIMNNEEEKNNIMFNLRKLKDAEEKFKKLRITDDYTIEEREEIRKWVQKARLKTSEEVENSRYVWCVRGSPKNGLRLVKVTRK